MTVHFVQLPATAARSIASCIRREARRLLHRPNPSCRDIQHGNRLMVYAELIDPREDR